MKKRGGNESIGVTKLAGPNASKPTRRHMGSLPALEDLSVVHSLYHTVRQSRECEAEEVKIGESLGPLN